MSGYRLSIRHRQQVIGRLGELAAELNDIATWLSGLDDRGTDAAAAKTETAADLAAASAWILSVPLRPAAEVVPQRWDGEPVNGYGHRPF